MKTKKPQAVRNEDLHPSTKATIIGLVIYFALMCVCAYFIAHPVHWSY